MTHAANVISGYLLTAVATIAYVVWVIRRGRKLSRSLEIGAGTDISEVSAAKSSAANTTYDNDSAADDATASHSHG